MVRSKTYGKTQGRSQGGPWGSWEAGTPNPIPLKIIKGKTCTHYALG